MLAAASTSTWPNDFARRLLLLPPQASSYAAEVDHLHFFVIGTTMVVSALIMVTALVFFVRFKQREPGTRGEFVGTTPIHEVLFVGVPLAFFVLWFGLGFNIYLKIKDPPQDAMEIYVQAKQWMWKFSYPDGPASEGTLRVPVGRPVKLLITSRDVIHSFYVPAFRVKQDAIPGRYTEVWFEAVAPGTYDIFCAEYCGTNHSYMRGAVVAVPANEFDAWMADQRRGLVLAHDASSPTADARGLEGDLVRQGERLAAEKGCLKCHSVDGTAHIGPTWLGLYHRKERLEGGAEVVVDEPYMTESMMAPAAKVVEGFRPVMPSYQGQLAPAEIAAIVEYIKSLRDLQLQAQPSARPVYGPQ